jgi:hypothetical protein
VTWLAESTPQSEIVVGIVILVVMMMMMEKELGREGTD